MAEHLMLGDDLADTAGTVVDIHRNAKVAAKKCGHICSEPCSTVAYICHDQNGRARGEFEGFLKMPMQ